MVPKCREEMRGRDQTLLNNKPAMWQLIDTTLISILTRYNNLLLTFNSSSSTDLGLSLIPSMNNRVLIKHLQHNPSYLNCLKHPSRCNLTILDKRMGCPSQLTRVWEDVHKRASNAAANTVLDNVAFLNLLRTLRKPLDREWTLVLSPATVLLNASQSVVLIVLRSVVDLTYVHLLAENRA